MGYGFLEFETAAQAGLEGAGAFSKGQCLEVHGTCSPIITVLITYDCTYKQLVTVLLTYNCTYNHRSTMHIQVGPSSASTVVCRRPTS